VLHELTAHRREQTGSYNGDFWAPYSNLSQINSATWHNASAMGIPFQIRTAGVTPVVVKRVMFATSAKRTYALDARPALIGIMLPTPGIIDDASGTHRGVAVCIPSYRQPITPFTVPGRRSGHLLWM